MEIKKKLIDYVDSVLSYLVKTFFIILGLCPHIIFLFGLVGIIFIIFDIRYGILLLSVPAASAMAYCFSFIFLEVYYGKKDK